PVGQGELQRLIHLARVAQLEGEKCRNEQRPAVEVGKGFLAGTPTLLTGNPQSLQVSQDSQVDFAQPREPVMRGGSSPGAQRPEGCGFTPMRVNYRTIH